VPSATPLADTCVGCCRHTRTHADLGAVLAELQQGVQSMGGELAKMAASSSTPDLAASIQGLTGAHVLAWHALARLLCADCVG
jgi:hypothetical protein